MPATSDAAVETFICQNCGATTSFDPGTSTLRCPFCGTQLAVRAEAAAAGVDVDHFVLPFSIQRDESQQRIREWLGSSFWAPSDLKSRSALDRGQGSYIPFWRFDADTHSEWEGEISRTHTRQVPRTRTNAEGKSERIMETETYKTWHPRSGEHCGSFRAWIPASTGLTQAEADRLMPFPEEGMMTYSTDLLVGFSAEEPGIDEDGAWVAGEQRIREMAREACSLEVERLTTVDTELSNPRSAVCQLPVWIYGYRYQNRDYRVLLNGYTGEVIGDRPISRTRVFLAVGIGIAVVIAIIVLIVMFS
ncbi:TFIIB-type zinc ribbon-containing protein [soil metagenome]